MMDYANVANLPKVKKCLSLDGEYNTEAHFQVSETLTSLLTNGPILKTPMYDYIAAHYSQISPETQIYLLEGNWNTAEQTDALFLGQILFPFTFIRPNTSTVEWF